MIRRFCVLLVALGLAGCSGSGSAPPSTPAPSNVPASISLALSSPVALSVGQSYALTVSAYNAAGTLISGSYANPVTLTTSDPTDSGFSSTVTGSGAASSVTVSSSLQSVFFYYDGASLKSPITVTTAATNVSAKGYVFTPSSSSGGSTTTTSATIATLSVGPNGALPQVGSAGSFTLTVAGYTSSGSLVTGTYATPIVLTSTDSTDLTFSVNGAAASATASIPSSSAIVVVNYDGATVPSGTTISVAASGATGASFVFHPTPAGSSTTSSIAKLTLAEVGATPNQGTPGQFALAVTASDSSGNPISGTYPSPVVVTTNDSTDLQLATSSGGPFTPSVSVSNSSTVIYVSYSGGDVPQSTEFAANTSGSVMGMLAFNPAVNTTQSLYIKTLYITTSGAPPDTNSYGSQPIYINAYDQNGNIFNGTYPSPVRATLNNATELDLSVGSYVAALDCEAGSPPPNPCPNVAAQVVNNSGQVIFGNYAMQYATYPSQVSISTSGVSCAAISFPLTGAATSGTGPATAPSGSSQYVCQNPNPAPTPTASPAASERGGRGSTYLVPIRRT